MSLLRTPSHVSALLRQKILASALAGHVALPFSPISSCGRPSSSFAFYCIQASPSPSAFPLRPLLVLIGARRPAYSFSPTTSISTSRLGQSRAHLSTTPATRSQTKHASPSKGKMTEHEEGSAKKKARTEEKYKLICTSFSLEVCIRIYPTLFDRRLAKPPWSR